MNGKGIGAFKTISEVASELGLPRHVLRFWESKFTVIKPVKRGGGRRYYRPRDIDLLHGIRFLLYSEGYTIKGVLKILNDRGVHYVMRCWIDDDDGLDAASDENDGLDAASDENDAGVDLEDAEDRDETGSLSDAHLVKLNQVLIDLKKARSLLNVD